MREFRCEVDHMRDGGVFVKLDADSPMWVSRVMPEYAARRLAHALLDAIGERDEAEAIVRDLAASDPIRLRLDGYHECRRCGGLDGGWGAGAPVQHAPDCPYLRARAFVAREGREETDHG